MAKEEKKQKHFFKDFKAELKKVIWPTPKQIVNNTIAVVVIVIITVIIVFALDSIFKLANNGVNVFKQSIKDKVSTNTTEIQGNVLEENTIEVEETNSVEE